MKKKRILFIILGFLLLVGAGIFLFLSREVTEELTPEKVDILGHETYVYIPKRKKDEKLPLVVTFHGRGGSATDVVHGSGWDRVAYKERFIVVSPQYDGYKNSYDITDDLIEVVKYAIKNYNVDETRVYASGFSMGGAASVALARDYPGIFAAIAPMGWMFDMPDKNDVYKNYDMPFLIIQGTNEFTYQDEFGNMAIHREEQKTVRSLLLFNELITEDQKTNLEEYPFWGFEGDKQDKVYANHKNWFIDEFYKEGYNHPFGVLIERENAEHTKDKYSSTLAWNFLKNYARDNDGSVIEIN